MARTAVASLCGGETRFAGADMSTKLKLMGVDVGSIGDAHASTAGAQELLLLDRVNGIYKKLVTDGEGNRLLGAILVGDGADYERLLQYYQNGVALPQPPLSLLVGEAGTAPRPWCCRTAPSSAPATTSARGTWWPPSGRAITSFLR